jgi:hypothetical protein
VIVLLKSMKRFLQVVSVFVVALLTAQPALAGLTCTMRALASVPCVPHCPMAMSQMARDCQMAQQAAGADCQPNCCRYPTPQAVVRSASKSRPKAARTPFVLAVHAVSQRIHPAFIAPPAGDLAAAAPPRHILLQVIRI